MTKCSAVPMPVSVATCVLVALLALFARCDLFEPSAQFTPEKWKSAKAEEKRPLARGFLRSHRVKGMSVSDIVKLLGVPDSEQDAFEYNLSSNGPPPAGPQPMYVFIDHPQLYVCFKLGIVEDLRLPYNFTPRGNRRFEQNEWATANPAYRQAMVADLISSNRLAKQSKAAVQSILGKPDAYSSEHTISYDLGYGLIDPVTLTFTLDSSETVRSAAIYEH